MTLGLARLALLLLGALLLVSPAARAVLLEGAVAPGAILREARRLVAEGGWLDLAGGAALAGAALLPGRLLVAVGNRLCATLAGLGMGTPLLAGADGASTGGRWRDSVFLALVSVAAMAPYLPHLGLYADDHVFLYVLSFSEDQSLAGLVGALYDEGHGRSRPVHMFYLAALYKLFGSEPLGYQTVNLAVVVAGVLLLHRLLGELAQPRAFALAVPLVYALLPHYSTDRIWIATFQIPLSVLFYFASLYADLRCLRAAGALAWAWRALAALTLVISVLAYEITLFLFLLNPLVARGQARRLALAGGGPADLRARVASGFAVNLALVAAALVFKAVMSQRMDLGAGPLIHIGRQLYILLSPFRALSDLGGLNLWKAIHIAHVEYGLGLPVAVWTVAREHAGPVEIGVALILGVSIFGYLGAVTRSGEALPADGRGWLRVAAQGVVVFAIGYAVFLLTAQIMLTPTGAGNRVSMAAAIGVALTLVGLIGCLATRLPAGRGRGLVFAGLVACVATSGCLVNGAIAGFWIAAAEKQREVLAAIRAGFPDLPHGTVLIVDGLCPYHGPGIVFETFWDMSAALRLLYRDDTLRGDVVTPNLRVTPSGMTGETFGERMTFPYGQNLVVFDIERRTTVRLTDQEAALRYFGSEAPRPDPGCPPSDSGKGLPIL